LGGVAGVVEVKRVTGPVDVIVVLEATNIEGISLIVNGRIHVLDGVTRTTTCVALA